MRKKVLSLLLVAASALTLVTGCSAKYEAKLLHVACPCSPAPYKTTFIKDTPFTAIILFDIKVQTSVSLHPKIQSDNLLFELISVLYYQNQM